MDKTLREKGFIKRKHIIRVKRENMRVKRHHFRHMKFCVVKRVERHLCFKMRSVNKKIEVVLLHKSCSISKFNAMDREVEKKLRRVKVGKNIIRSHSVRLCRSRQVIQRRERNRHNSLFF